MTIRVLLLAAQSHLHVFDRPRTFEIEASGVRIGVTGFACEREGIRHRFDRLLAEPGWAPGVRDLDLLCLHQTVEVSWPRGTRKAPRTATAAISGGDSNQRSAISDQTVELAPNPSC